MMYVAIILAIITALFVWSVVWWLRAFPVLPLNHVYEQNYARAYPSRRAPAPTYHLGVQSLSAQCGALAAQVVVEHRREAEKRFWG